MLNTLKSCIPLPGGKVNHDQIFFGYMKENTKFQFEIKDVLKIIKHL